MQANSVKHKLNEEKHQQIENFPAKCGNLTKKKEKNITLENIYRDKKNEKRMLHESANVLK